MKRKVQDFTVLIERDEEGWLVASVPQLRGRHTQARTLEKLMVRIREAIKACLDVEKLQPDQNEFVGVQRIAV